MVGRGWAEVGGEVLSTDHTLGAVLESHLVPGLRDKPSRSGVLHGMGLIGAPRSTMAAAWYCRGSCGPQWQCLGYL